MGCAIDFKFKFTQSRRFWTRKRSRAKESLKTEGNINSENYGGDELKNNETFGKWRKIQVGDLLR